MDKNKIDLSRIQRKNIDIESKPKPKSIPKNTPPVISVEEKLINDAKKMHKKEPRKLKPTGEEGADVNKIEKEDPSERRRMILILQLYLNEFSEALVLFKNVNLDKKTLPELIEIKSQMDGVITSKTGLKQTQLMVTSGIRMIEFVTCNFTPIKCEGLSQTMLHDPDIVDNIKLIALKRMSTLSVEPEARLLYQIASNMMLLHNINSQQSGTGLSIIKEDQKNINSVNDQYQDL